MFVWVIKKLNSELMDLEFYVIAIVFIFVCAYLKYHDYIKKNRHTRIMRFKKKISKIKKIIKKLEQQNKIYYNPNYKLKEGDHLIRFIWNKDIEKINDSRFKISDMIKSKIKSFKFFLSHYALAKHHGIYIGDNEVIHFTNVQTYYKKNAIVVQTSFEKFMGEHDIYFVCLHEYNQVYSLNDVILKAKESLNRMGYNLFKYNCEDFAINCKIKNPNLLKHQRNNVLSMIHLYFKLCLLSMKYKIDNFIYGHEPQIDYKYKKFIKRKIKFNMDQYKKIIFSKSDTLTPNNLELLNAKILKL